MSFRNYAKGRFDLHNGLKIPALGIDTSQADSYEEVRFLVDIALSAGYQLFKTKACTRNVFHEKFLGEALNELLPIYNLDREDVFVCTSLRLSYSSKPEWTSRFVQSALCKSLEVMKMDYVDLYTITFDEQQFLAPYNPKRFVTRKSAWYTLLGLYDDGYISSIGVAGFPKYQISQLISDHYMAPLVNRVPFNPEYRDENLVRYCDSHMIRVQTCSIFGGLSYGSRALIDHPTVIGIAHQQRVSPAQVMIAWALQQDVAVIPNSTTPKHIRENISINFRLTHQHMEILNNLKFNNRNLKRPYCH